MDKVLDISMKKYVKFRYKQGTEQWKDLLMPINPLGTYASRITIEGYRKIFGGAMREIELNEGAYPVLFVYNGKYGGSQDSDKYLGGVSLDPKGADTEKTGLKYILGYSGSLSPGEWKNRQGSRYARLFFTLIVDDILFDKIKDFNDLRISTDRTIVASNVRKWVIEARDVKAYLRQTPLVSDSAKEQESTTITPGDLELIYLGSQISGYAWRYSDSAGSNQKYRPRKFLFLFPLVIPFSLVLPTGSSDEPLPRDLILNVPMLNIQFKGLDCNKIQKLADWIFSKHKESLVKILLNRELLKTLVNILSDDIIFLKQKEIYKKLYPLEVDVNTKIYYSKLKFLSPNLRLILRIYDNRNLKNTKNITEFVVEIIKTLLNQDDLNNQINTDVVKKRTEELLKRAIGIYALAHGLHGVSHLTMKVLSNLSGLDQFGERIVVGMESCRFEMLGKIQDMIIENTFEFRESESNSHILIFGKKPFTYDYVKNVFQGQDLDQVMRNELMRILTRDGRDSCEENFDREKRLIGPAKNLLLASSSFGQMMESTIKDYINERILATRTIYRYLYEWNIRPAIVKSGIREEERRLLNTFAQFILPYYVNQCVDGCHNCVIVGRNVGSGLCDMSPLEQEMKISKWAALCLLKYKGWVNLPWVDCDLT
ncbi:hypothetical protein [Metallosphaera javensis (ex Hofmann et al. 2022)]|uniref:hypothetical protein n=1 Tax=Metallosphaera javensis (ex Hofmann et al. 2022) TaxID=99938 RepID=UPI001EDDF554|nr:hypothetical protein [Metallosphaera javensis (ex Hofmann et al. 2022)]